MVCTCLWESSEVTDEKSALRFVTHQKKKSGHKRFDIWSYDPFFVSSPFVCLLHKEYAQAHTHTHTHTHTRHTSSLRAEDCSMFILLSCLIYPRTGRCKKQNKVSLVPEIPTLVVAPLPLCQRCEVGRIGKDRRPLNTGRGNRGYFETFPCVYGCIPTLVRLIMYGILPPKRYSWIHRHSFFSLSLSLSPAHTSKYWIFNGGIYIRLYSFIYYWLFHQFLACCIQLDSNLWLACRVRYQLHHVTQFFFYFLIFIFLFLTWKHRCAIYFLYAEKWLIFILF